MFFFFLFSFFFFLFLVRARVESQWWECSQEPTCSLSRIKSSDHFIEDIDESIQCKVVGEQVEQVDTPQEHHGDTTIPHKQANVDNEQH